jgi:hypothetical protein
MSSAQKIQPHTRATYKRGVVQCQKCNEPIHVHKINVLPDEFSVQCHRCGYRGVYLTRSLHIEDVPERRKKPRR